MREVGAFERTGLSLTPRDRTAREIIAQLADGARVLVEVWHPRNMGQHRAYFAMLDRVVQASGRWPSREALEFDIALALRRGGFVEAHDGSRHFRPDSRAVASMPRADFERLHSDTLALLTGWLGCSPDALQEDAA